MTRIWFCVLTALAVGAACCGPAAAQVTASNTLPDAPRHDRQPQPVRPHWSFSSAPPHSDGVTSDQQLWRSGPLTSGSGDSDSILPLDDGTSTHLLSLKLTF
ncbi:MAG: hypothetical protein QM773_06805 [Hyphomonadaceae bacterium]